MSVPRLQGCVTSGLLYATCCSSLLLMFPLYSGFLRGGGGCVVFTPRKREIWITAALLGVQFLLLACDFFGLRIELNFCRLVNLTTGTATQWRVHPLTNRAVGACLNLYFLWLLRYALTMRLRKFGASETGGKRWTSCTLAHRRACCILVHPATQSGGNHTLQWMFNFFRTVHCQQCSLESMGRV